MIYLDNSATSFPKPESVYHKMDTFYRQNGANPGRSGHKLSLRAAQEVGEVRNLTAQLLHSPGPENVAFTFNATDALNMAILGVLRKGDEVITTVLEHNSVSRPIAHSAQKLDLKIHTVEPVDHQISIEAIRKKLTNKTRLVAVTHASNVTGWVQPVEEIGNFLKKEAPHVFFLVDAAQTAGLIPIDVQAMNIDLLAFTGHKALYGPTGTGGLYVADHVEIEPFRTGGSGIDSETDLHPDTMPYRLEAGTENLLGLAGLGEGIRFVQQTGRQKLLEHDRNLKNLLYDLLRPLEHLHIYTEENPSAGLGILSFRLDHLSPIEIASVLDAENIAVRAGLHCAPGMHRFLGTYPAGTVRVSCGFFNHEAEITGLADIIKSLI